MLCHRIYDSEGWIQRSATKWSRVIRCVGLSMLQRQNRGDIPSVHTSNTTDG